VSKRKAEISVPVAAAGATVLSAYAEEDWSVDGWSGDMLEYVRDVGTAVSAWVEGGYRRIRFSDTDRPSVVAGLIILANLEDESHETERSLMGSGRYDPERARHTRLAAQSLSTAALLAATTRNQRGRQ